MRPETQWSKSSPDGKSTDIDGIFSSLHGEGLALAELRGFLLVQDRGVAGEDVDVAAVVKVVEAEGALAGGLNRKVAAGDAEIVSACGIYVEGSGALAENQARGACAIFERKIEELENGVFVEKSHCAVFKLDLSAAIVGGKHVALTDGEIGLGSFPLCLLVRERISLGFSSKTHIALNKTEANNTGVAGVSVGRLAAYQEGEE